ncbi:MAG TPA: hypothetical protein VFM46_08880, partial [Pseudomonadales bacterium]|nr:hypothetical protein [Pseudomonadales bacterium]
MASNFSLSTLLGSVSPNAVSADKSPLIQLDKSDGADFHQALFQAQTEPPSASILPPAAKTVANAAPSGGNLSPAPEDKPPSTNTASSKPDSEETKEATQQDTAKADQTADGKATAKTEQKGKPKDKESGDDEDKEKTSVTDEDKTAQTKDVKLDGDAKAVEVKPLEVQVTADAATPDAASIVLAAGAGATVQQGRAGDEKAAPSEETVEQQLKSGRNSLAAALDLTATDKPDEATAKADKSVAQTNKTMSSLEFKLQVQASQMEAKTEGTADLVSSTAAKKDLTGHLTEINNLGSSLGSARTQASPLLSTSIKTPMGHPSWGAEVAEKVLWMASQKVQS